MNDRREPVGVRDGGRVTVRPTDAGPPPVLEHAVEARHRVAEPHNRELEIPPAYNLPQDRVRWGPIWAGLLTAMTSLLLLSLLGAALGLAGLDAGQAAVQGGPPPEAGRNAGLWGGLSGVLSFLLGGYVAARTATVFGRGWGALNGALVFMLGVPVTLLLAGMGLGTILGSLGSFVGGLNVDPGTTANAAQGAADQAREATRTVSPEDARRAAETARNAAMGAFGGSLLALGASALGGFFGTRRHLEFDRRTGTPHEE